MLTESISELQKGKIIIMHCYAGLGRTGTIAACFLVKLGINSSDAINLVRKTRSGTIETVWQEEFI